MYSRILSTGSALPSRRIDNDEFTRMLAERGIETSDEWIRTRTGIEARHFCDPDKGETTTTLAVAAASDALARASLTGADVDLVVVATTTPDVVFPSTAARVQAAIGAAGSGAFDVQAVCAGFVYALSAADAMIRTGAYKRALVIGAETMSRVIDMNDRSTCVLFGDGAGAVVLEASDTPGILAARMYADGREDEKVLGLCSRVEGGVLTGDPFIRMEGRRVYALAVEGLVSSARTVLEAANLTPDAIDLFVPHQANLRIMTTVCKKLGLADDAMIRTVSEHGNTSAASVPLALDVAA